MLHQHQRGTTDGGDHSSGFGTLFLGDDLNMGMGTGIKTSRKRRKFVKCSDASWIFMSGDIAASRGDGICERK